MPPTNHTRRTIAGGDQFGATGDLRQRSQTNVTGKIQPRGIYSQTHLLSTGTTYSWLSDDSILAVSTHSLRAVQGQPLLQTQYTSPRTLESGNHPLQVNDVTRNQAANDLIANAERRSRISPLSKLSREREKKLKYFRGWWFWEVLSLSLCVLSIIAVVILAAKLDGTLLSNWTVAVAPNTVISVLITIAKTSMLVPIAEGISQLKWSNFWLHEAPLYELVAFDEASRGPWGSLMFLWPNKNDFKRRPLLSLVAAFLTVASLALGPFAQQIVAFKSERVERPGMEASIPVTQRYESRKWQDDAAYLFGGAGSREIEGAFFNGLYGSSIPTEFICPSGNCSWPEFLSFGLCDSCGDVSKASRVTLQYYLPHIRTKPVVPTINHKGGVDIVDNPDDWISVLTPTGFKLNELEPTSTIYASSNSQSSFTGPVSVRSSNTLHDYVKFAIGRSGTSDLWLELSKSIEKIWATNSTPAVLPITDSEFANLTYDEPNARLYITFLDTSIANISVFECAINWCAKKYQNVAVENGHILDYSIIDIPLHRLNNSSLAAPDHYWESFRPLNDATYLGNATPIYPFNETIFFLTETDDVLISYWLTIMLDTNLRSRNPIQGFGISSALAYGTDIPEVIHNVATSLTNTIRTSRASTHVKGTVWAHETFIYIQWVWLSLPVALVLLSVAVLVATATSTHRSDIPLWKSSLLPLMFHGVEEWDTEVHQEIKMGLLEERRAMEQRARSLGVSLSRSEFGESRFIQDTDISQRGGDSVTGCR